MDRASGLFGLAGAARVPDQRNEAAVQWGRIREQLLGELGEAGFRAWFRNASLGRAEVDAVTLHFTSRFICDYVRTHYGDRLRALWQAANPAIRGVDFHVCVEATAAAAAGIIPSEPEAARMAEPHGTERADGERGEGNERGDRAEMAGPLDARFTFDGFVVGKPNEFAYACSRRVAERPASAGFNPLFLYGGVGLGKTHLMHAIAWEMHLAKPSVSIVYMSAERFMYRFIAALRSQSQMEFKEQLRGVDVLMIDDLQFLIGKDSTQEEFFHTFNALIDSGKQIVLSADKSPSDLSGITDRLRTRLGCGMVADLHATTYELRISILEAKAARAGTEVSPKVIEYLAQRITTNVRELEGALNRLFAYTNLFGRAITIETAQEVLRDILKAHERRVSIDEIQKKVCDHYNIRLTDMSSARRARSVARPRQVAMYLAKQLTARSLPEIGRRFGNRDHTTVIHGINRVVELMQRDAQFGEDVEMLRRALEG